MNRRDFFSQSSGALLASTIAAPQEVSSKMSHDVPRTFIHRLEADGIEVFYREAGSRDAPVILLLHGFPTSSFQYRELIPRLAGK